MVLRVGRMHCVAVVLGIGGLYSVVVVLSIFVAAYRGEVGGCSMG